MGGEKNIIKLAKQSYENGEYRWVAEVLNHIIAINPNNKEARILEANALEQLGYQSESATWRAYFLTAAKELRRGINKNLVVPKTSSADIINSLPIQKFLDYLAVRVNPDKANNLNISMNIIFTDSKENYSINLKNSVLNTSTELFKSPDTTLKLTRAAFNKLVSGVSIDELVKKKEVFINNKEKAKQLFSTFENFEFWFNVSSLNY